MTINLNKFSTFFEIKIFFRKLQKNKLRFIKVIKKIYVYNFFLGVDYMFFVNILLSNSENRGIK